MPRTILVHLNVELPDGPFDDLGSDDIGEQVRAALEVGTDPDETPALAASTVVVAMTDEV
jgi:hypothetical protein